MRILIFKVLVVSLLVVGAGAAAAQDGTPLAFKFSPGDVLEYDIMLSGSGGLRAPDGELSTMGLQGSARLEFTVVGVNADGSGRIQALLPRANFQVNVAQERARFSYENGLVRWYSNGQEQTPPDADISQVPLLGKPLEFVASPKGQILDVVMPEIGDLAASQGLGGMQQMVPGFTAPDFKNMGEPIFPDHPVRVGETWRKTAYSTPFGPSIPVAVTQSRTLESIDDQFGVALARISGYAETRVTVNPTTISPGEMDMTVSVPEVRQTVTSTEFFNTTEGKLVRGDYDLSFVTRVSMFAQEQSQEASIEARLHSTVQAR